MDIFIVTDRDDCDNFYIKGVYTTLDEARSVVVQKIAESVEARPINDLWHKRRWMLVKEAYCRRPFGSKERDEADATAVRELGPEPKVPDVDSPIIYTIAMGSWGYAEPVEYCYGAEWQKKQE